MKPQIFIGKRFTLIETRKKYTVTNMDVFGFTAVSDDHSHTITLNYFV